MSTQPTYFRTGVVRPLDCFSEGWRLIRDQYPLMIGISLVGIIIASAVPFGILQGPMMCGIYICLFALARGERIEFGTLFKGFDHFVPSLIATLVYMVPLLLVLVPAYLAFIVFFVMAGMNKHAGAGPEVGVFMGGFLLLVLLIMLVSLVLGVLLVFAYPLIVDRRLSGWEACRTSARAALGNVGGVLSLVLLCSLLGFAGMLMCYVGAFLVLPICFAATSVAYRDVFGGEPG